MSIMLDSWEDRNIIIQGQPGQNVSKTLALNTRWVWWPSFVITATWEVKVGGSWAEADPRQKCEAYLKNN
jgi:hypothetical protein